jgi:protein phosphatase
MKNQNKPKLSYCGLSVRGRVRLQNEDNWFADAKQGLFLVSDGMGGEVAGALASRIVVEVLPRLLHERLGEIKNLSVPEAQPQTLAALAALSAELRNKTQGQPGLEGMGATVVLALIRDGQVLIAHLGDSRAYLFRNERLVQLTKDHSVVQLLLDAGEIKPEEAATHPARGRLTRYVGMADEPLPEACCFDLIPGDCLLLCTDGLTGMVSGLTLRSILRSHLSPNKTCKRLIAAANAAGGKDNVTAVVLSDSA